MSFHNREKCLVSGKRTKDKKEKKGKRKTVLVEHLTDEATLGQVSLQVV
jgi:hypothetical protein